MARTCGGCTMCCKVLGIDEIKKPRSVWCPKIRSDKKGCSIYGTSEFPHACGTFQCQWLWQEDIPESLRPDKTHAVITALVGESGFVFDVDPGRPDALEREPLKTWVAYLRSEKFKILKYIGGVVYHMDWKGNWMKGQIIETKDGRTTSVIHGETPSPENIQKYVEAARIPIKLLRR